MQTIIAPVPIDPHTNLYFETYILGNSFTWNFSSTETKGPIMDKPCPTKWCRAPVFTHTLVQRTDPKIKQGKAVSAHWDLIKSVFDRWMLQQEMTAPYIYRAVINLSLHQPFDHSEPHVDHAWSHKNWIWYLDTMDAPTLLFDEDLNITERIPCVKNTAAVFDGRLHAQSYASPCTARRVVVITFGDDPGDQSQVQS